MWCLTPFDRDAFCSNPARNAKLLISNTHLPVFTPQPPTASQTLMNSSSQNPPKLKWNESPPEFKPEFQAYPVIMTAQLKPDVAKPDSACDTETLYFQNLIPNHRELNTAKTSAWEHSWLIKYDFFNIYIIILKMHKQKCLVEHWTTITHQHKTGILS